jgi:hypothetical protein
MIGKKTPASDEGNITLRMMMEMVMQQTHATRNQDVNRVCAFRRNDCRGTRLDALFIDSLRNSTACGRSAEL